MSKVTAYNNKPYPLVYLYTSDTSQDKNEVKKINKATVFILSLFIIICLLLSGIAFYFYKTSSEMAFQLSQGFEEKAKLIVGKLSKITILPASETPKVDIVTDLQNFQDYEFSKDLKIGDYILIYKSASKVYAFREGANMLVGIQLLPKSQKVAGVTDEKTNQENASISSSANSTKTEEKMFNIKIINGGKIVGVGSDFQKKLQAHLFPGIRVTTVEAALVNTYKGDKIVVIKSEASKVAEALAKKYSLELVELPEGEKVADDTDILIIIGNK